MLRRAYRRVYLIGLRENNRDALEAVPMTTEPAIDACGWAKTLHRLHKEMTGCLIAGHLAMNANNPVALANWVLISAEFVKFSATQPQGVALSSGS